MWTEAGPSLKLYRLFGITVRLHWSFFILPLVILMETGQAGMLQWGLLLLVATYGIILFHEYGHALTARRLGAGADEIILGALGGVSMCGEGRTAFEDVLVAFAGPMVNIFVGGGLLLPLALADTDLGWKLFHPLAYWGLYDPLSIWPAGFLVWLFKVNLILLLFNLMPIYPLDGGRVFTGLLAMRLGRRRALLLSTPVAIPLAVLMIGLALLWRDLILVLIGLWILYVAHRVYRAAKLGLVQEYPGDYAAPGDGWWADLPWSRPVEARPKRPGLFTRWKMKRRARRRRKEEEAARRLREDVDRILDKVSREGMGSLTASERRTLEEASRKYRGG